MGKLLLNWMVPASVPQFGGKCSVNVRCSGSSSSVSHSSRAVREFKMSDFDLYSHVSIGLGGRSGEILYEGIVKNPDSGLKGMRVVLRQFTGTWAQRRGKRALEVISKLISKEGVYHSYGTRVHGFIPDLEQDYLTLVHGFYGCYSLHHWLLCVDWLPNLEARLALDEEASRRVGDDTTGGPQVTRQLRLIRMIMRDILIGINYLHSQGLAHTEVRLNNLHVSAADRHVKVGILGNAVAFSDLDSSRDNLSKRMVAYDVRCIGYVMARLVLREFTDPTIFWKFKNFFMEGHDPACLREYLYPYLCAKSPHGSTGLQVLDRDGGAGWNLLSCMLATDPSRRISCTDALRHPFLCGPRWLSDFTIDMVRWSLGSAVIRIIEEYIYMSGQRTKLAQLIDLLERVNANRTYADWIENLPGRWRLLYHTGRQIGLTRRQASPAVLIGNVVKHIARSDDEKHLSITVNVPFTVLTSSPSGHNGSWPHDKSGDRGSLRMHSARVGLRQGERLYQIEAQVIDQNPVIKRLQQQQEQGQKRLRSRSRKRVNHLLPQQAPKSLPIMRLDVEDDFDISMQLDSGLGKDVALVQKLIAEVRHQVPREAFAVSKIACATYVDARILVVRGISGAALFYTRCPDIVTVN